MTNEQWSAVTDYLSVYVGNELTGGTASLTYPLHPALQSAFGIIE